MKAPFPWFGGKSTVAPEVWDAFGDVTNYVEPFFGSGAVLLNRPVPFHGPETVNDKDGFLSNFWRAIQHDPEATAVHADWPVNENDLHARHVWLVAQRETLTARLEGDPDFHDPKIAGWWVWGICSWIGSGWCSGNGPWRVQDGLLVDPRQLPHLGPGRGINRKLPHLGDAGRGINRKLPHLGDAGMGINRKLPHLGDAGMGAAILDSFTELADRLRGVRVCCGDWSRVMGESVTTKHPGITGIFLDPPYADTADRQDGLYSVDSATVAHDVRAWAIVNGKDPKMRIALCGYQGEHEMPAGWYCLEWKARGGFGNQGEGRGRENAAKERIWFSPACIRPQTEPTHPSLFDEAQA